MKQLIYGLKGFAIGIANIIPGFSGGTMAVILKIYNEFVDALGSLVTHPIKMIKSYYGLYIGVALGLISALLVIVKLLDVAPIATVMLFVGLIIGTIPNIAIEAKDCGKSHFYDYIGFFLALALIVCLPLIPGSEKEVGSITFFTVMMLIISGVCASSAMIIPGVSGSLILMVLGYYLYILSTVKDFISNILAFDFSGILNNVVVLVAFAIGIILGLVYITKLIKKMFDKTPKLTYLIILGLLFGSPFSIIYSVNKEFSKNLNLDKPLTYVFGILSLIVGAILSGYIPKKFEKK